MQTRCYTPDTSNVPSQVLQEIKEANQIYVDLCKSGAVGQSAILRLRDMIFGNRGIDRSITNVETYYPRGVKRKDHTHETTSAIKTVIKDQLGLGIIAGPGSSWYIYDGQSVVGMLIREISGMELNFQVTGVEQLVNDVVDLIKITVDMSVPPIINRLYVQDRDNSLNTTREYVPLHNDNIPVDLMYPFFDKSPAEIWEEYKASESNVLLLIGPPGVGKSNFILEMMKARGFDSTIYLADEDIVLQNHNLASFIRSLDDGSVMITEDSDKMVGKREDGNSQMSGLLNATAGLVSRDTKIIISTNLPTVRDVDQALLRPGRAFRVLKFRELQGEEIAKLQEARTGKYPAIYGVNDKATLAEVLNGDLDSSDRKATAIGFG